MITRASLAGTALLGRLSPSGALAAVIDMPHPFILWTKDDEAAIRKRAEKSLVGVGN